MAGHSVRLEQLKVAAVVVALVLWVCQTAEQVEVGLLLNFEPVQVPC
jgi:hypothetical protein